MLNVYANYVSDYTWIIVFLSIILLYFINWYRRPNHLPPGPRGVPILGYLPFLGKRPEKTLFYLTEKYGKILTVRMGAEDAVFLNDFHSLHRAFVKNGETLSGRRPLAHVESVMKGNGLISLDYGPKWKSQRKFGLMSLRGFGVGKKQMEKVCLEEVRYINEVIKNNCGKPYDLLILLRNAISNNICSVALGRRFDYNDGDFHNLMKFITNAFGNSLSSFVNRLIVFAPVMQHVPPVSFIHRKFLKTIQSVLDWLNEIVEEHEKTFDENNLRDFIDAFIVEKRKGKDDSFKNEQLLCYITDIFVAGTLTTSTTLYWSLLCMLHHPEAQKKLREEIVNVFGSSGTISMTRKADLPYTNAFIQEVYRYRTLTPLGVPHKANVDTQMDGYVIPENTQVFSNLWAVHNDPNLWKDPEKFLPERFLDEHGNFVSSNYVIPFGVGPRHCVGEQLARMEVFIFLVGMVQKFEFLPDPNASELPTIDDGSMGVGFSPIPFSLVARET